MKFFISIFLLAFAFFIIGGSCEGKPRVKAKKQKQQRQAGIGINNSSHNKRNNRQNAGINQDLLAAENEVNEFTHTTRQHLYTMDVSPTAMAELDATVQVETDEEVAQILLHSYRQRAFRDGDVIIGVLLPIHRPASAKSYPVRCSIIWEEYGMHRMEQLIWTIEEINRRQDILPGVTLGYDIRDTCWTTQVALERTMDFIKSKAGDDQLCSPAGTGTSQHRSPLAAILGAASSEISVAVQEVAQMFDIPQVDFGSTSPQLSDKSMFRLFARVIPSDQEQATMLVDVIRHFGWQYVHGIYTEGNYGEKGYEAFRDVLGTSNVCLASSRKFLLRVPDNHEQYSQLINDLGKHPDTRVIVCFCDGLGVRALFRTLTKHNLNGSYVVVGSDGWNVRKDIIRGFESAANGGLSVTHWSPRVPDFEERFYALTPHTVSHERNPWFAEYWAQKHGCLMSASTLLGLTASPFSRRVTSVRSLKTVTTFPFLRSERSNDWSNLTTSTPPLPRVRFCTGNETTPVHERLKQEAKLGFVVNSVYAVAHAIKNIQQRFCWDRSIRNCEHLYPFVNGSLLFESLRTVSFHNYAGELVRFDSNMDGVGKYQLWNFQSVPGTSKPTLYRYMPIGEWENNELLINDSVIVWPTNMTLAGHNKKLPPSFCSKPCNYDQIKVIPNVALPCCWDCLACPAGAYVSNGTRCVTCKPGFAPNEMLTDCEKVKIRFRNLSEIESVVIVTIASVGMIGILIVWFAYYFTRRLSVPRAFSLVGVLVTFTTVFSLLSRPTLLTCYFSRILPPIAQSILFAPIFNRANAMVRIIDSSRKLIIDRRPRFISTNSQIALTCFLVGAQCTVVVMMLIWEAADVKIVYPSFNVALLVCRSTFVVTAIPLAFNGAIMFLSMLYSLRTRKIKEMIRSDEAIFYPVVLGANTLLSFSTILLFYALGREDHLITAAHQLIAGFSTMIMFTLPLFRGPEQVDFDENTFAESVRHDINQRHSLMEQRKSVVEGVSELDRLNSMTGANGAEAVGKVKRVRRRKSVSMRLWDTMTVMREVAASTRTRPPGLGDDLSTGRSTRRTSARVGGDIVSGSNSEDVFQQTGSAEGSLKRENSKKSLKRRFFNFSTSRDGSSQQSTVDSKEREKQERYYRCKNAHVLVTAPSDDSGTPRHSTPEHRDSLPKEEEINDDDSPQHNNEDDEPENDDEALKQPEDQSGQEEEEEELQVSYDDEETMEPTQQTNNNGTSPAPGEAANNQQCWKSLSRKTDQLLSVPSSVGTSTSVGGSSSVDSKVTSSESRDSIKAAVKQQSLNISSNNSILNAVNLRGATKYGATEPSSSELCRSFKSPPNGGSPVKKPPQEEIHKIIKPPSLPPPPIPAPFVRKAQTGLMQKMASMSSGGDDTGEDGTTDSKPYYTRIRPFHVVDSRFSEGSSANIHLGGLIADFSPHRSFEENLSAAGESGSLAGGAGGFGNLAETSSADSLVTAAAQNLSSTSWRTMSTTPLSSNIRRRQQHAYNEEVTSFSLSRAQPLLQTSPGGFFSSPQPQPSSSRHIYGTLDRADTTPSRSSHQQQQQPNSSSNRRTFKAELIKDGKKATRI